MTTTQVSAPVVTRVSLVAPITGVLVPIEQVPDPVFAQKMVGEGISIDPLSNVLVAPCDGEVFHIHPAKHALTIRSAEGLEVLTHIGLDTGLAWSVKRHTRTPRSTYCRETCATAALA